MGAKVQGKRRVLQALAGIGGWGWSPSRERGPEPRPSSLAGARPAAALRLPPLASLGFSSVTETHLQGPGGCGERSVDATSSLEITQRKRYQPTAISTRWPRRRAEYKHSSFGRHRGEQVRPPRPAPWASSLSASYSEGSQNIPLRNSSPASLLRTPAL